MAFPTERLPGAALLSVDGGGQSLLIARRRLTIGHVRSGRADLGLLADVGACHAELVPRESLTGGPGWQIAPLEGERVVVAGQLLAGPRRLGDGDLVELGPRVALRHRVPDLASESVLLELEGGLDCLGARRIVLLGAGRGGRVRIGAAAERLLRIANLDLEVELELAGDVLEVRGGLVPLGESPEWSRRLAFPPRERVDLACGPPRGARPPFALSLEPVHRPFPTAVPADGGT
jgi:hypothetical protein